MHYGSHGSVCNCLLQCEREHGFESESAAMVPGGSRCHLHERKNESARVDIMPNMGTAALIIQSAWRRAAMRWRVAGAVAGADEQAWGRALAHLQLLFTDMSP
ncbi:hypothetical protein HPB49_003835 [Dermacentor silvarum]|uniref:Uncharacterized protein n=1 Tax=Dermacentor silvarum TaxID=543639 RepID=A0ACB8D2S0_DERSI|nr:hypothetical protein HPB49_003835 [Dermacentor silvarum]